jgi:hypothetical protein
MTKKSYTIQLDGEVTLDKFYQALEAWHKTLVALSKSIDENYSHPILIDDLSYGSAIAAVCIEFDLETTASQFEHGFESMARHIRSNTVHELPKPLRQPGKRLQEVAKLDGGEGFTLSSEDFDFLIDPKHWTASTNQYLQRPDNVEAFGTVTGRLQSLNSRGSLKVRVYDDLNDKAVRISLTDEQHENLRGLWDMNVVVEGLVRRDPESGRPLSMTNVQNIYKKDEPGDPFAWRKARGVLSHIHPEKSSEQLIREARNA